MLGNVPALSHTVIFLILTFAGTGPVECTPLPSTKNVAEGVEGQRHNLYKPSPPTPTPHRRSPRGLGFAWHLGHRLRPSCSRLAVGRTIPSPVQTGSLGPH